MALLVAHELLTEWLGGGDRQKIYFPNVYGSFFLLVVYS